MGQWALPPEKSVPRRPWYQVEAGRARPTGARSCRAATRAPACRYRLRVPPGSENVGRRPDESFGGSRDVTMKPTPAEKRSTFRALHAQGIFVLPNPWDIGSARML